MKRLAFTVVLLGATASFAIDPAPAVVPVQVDVVRASTDGSGQTEVPPSLKKMQSDLSSRIKYSSMKVVSTKQLQLKKQAEIIDLPNQNHAELTLEKLKDGVATVKVRVPPTGATYTLAKEKSLYYQAGTHEGADVWLVLSQPK